MSMYACCSVCRQTSGRSRGERQMPAEHKTRARYYKFGSKCEIVMHILMCCAPESSRNLIKASTFLH